MYLNCHTYYSLRYGTFSVEALCELGKKHGLSSMALTDINNTSACINFIKIAPSYGIRPLVGIDFRDGVQQQYVGIARNNDGFQQLNAHLSRRLGDVETTKCEDVGSRGSGEKEIETTATIATELSECYIIYPLEQVVSLQKKEFHDNEFIGVSIESLRKLRFSPYREYTDKLVLLQPVSFRNKRDFNAHRLLRCIGLNTLLSKLPENEQGRSTDVLSPLESLQKEFEDFPHILENTQQLMSGCEVQFGFGNKRCNQNLQVFDKSPEEDAQALQWLTYERLQQRYPELTSQVRERVKKELKAIIDLGFTSYFLINHDIIEYARSKGYPYIGRGSGANSIVAYIIGITNVDPIELDLYFERFINAHRNSPPDFDIDFSWKDREDVTAYIFKKYEHTALLSAYVTFKRKAVARELGKVFGLPKENIDKLSAGHYNLHELDEVESLVLRYAHLIEGFPNYLSVHSGGIMILNRSVHNFAATFLPPKGFSTVQIDMNISEEVGIFKFDILAQRGLPKITDAIEIIRQNQPEAYIEDIDNVNVFKNDPNINALLSRGDCMGVFYVESPAMRGLLTKLQTDNYLELVAASSIIRPGVSNGGMKDEYILRHRLPQRRKQAHPVLYEILKETYGVMVYQEDVLKVAHFFAGLSFEEADVLRRGMSGKKTWRGQIEKIEQQFRDNCRKNGYSEVLTNEVWEQIASFAGYAFPKGHSASYAVESYQSLYLKCYFPLEFMVAALNNGGGFYDVETYIQEIRRWGGFVHPPCINLSDHPTSISGKDIYLGLGYIKKLELRTVEKILESRQLFGVFEDMDDFINRVNISLEQLAVLLKVDAFRFTGLNKHHLLWKAHFKLNRSRNKSMQGALFKPAHRDFQLPKFEHSRVVDAYDQLEMLGFTLYNHFQLCKIPTVHNEVKEECPVFTDTMKGLNHAKESILLEAHPVSPEVMVRDLERYVGREVLIYGDLITTRELRTRNRKLMYFGTFYDMEGNVFDTVEFPGVAERYPLHSKGVYLCRGKVEEELGYYSITLNWLERQETIGDPRR